MDAPIIHNLSSLLYLAEIRALNHVPTIPNLRYSVKKNVLTLGPKTFLRLPRNRVLQGSWCHLVPLLGSWRSWCRTSAELRCQPFTSFVSMDISRRCTLWLFNIAMENGPFLDGLPIKNGDFPWRC